MVGWRLGYNTVPTVLGTRLLAEVLGSLVLVMILLMAGQGAAAQQPVQILLKDLPKADKPPLIVVWKAQPEIIDRMVREIPPTNEERYQRLRKFFDEVECRGKNLQEQSVPKSEDKNLICTLPGKTNDLIVIAAHYDFKGKGAGAVDDWSGAAMLPMVYRALLATVPQHTVIFAEFAGSRGARTFLDRLDKQQRKSIVAMVGLQSLGLGAVHYSGTAAAGGMMAYLENQMGDALGNSAEMLKGMKRPDTQRIWGSTSARDSREFHELGVPSLTIHSVSLKTRMIGGSEQDLPQAIGAKDYYDAYQLVSTYSSYLDQSFLWGFFKTYDPPPGNFGRH